MVRLLFSLSMGEGCPPQNGPELTHDLDFLFSHPDYLSTSAFPCQYCEGKKYIIQNFIHFNKISQNYREFCKNFFRKKRKYCFLIFHMWVMWARVKFSSGFRNAKAENRWGRGPPGVCLSLTTLDSKSLSCLAAPTTSRWLERNTAKFSDTAGSRVSKHTACTIDI